MLPRLTVQIKKPGPAKRKFVRESANAIAFAELCLVLSTGEWSREELCEKVGISDSCLRGWLRYLKSRDLIYICERRRSFKTGAAKIIWAWNTGFEYKDAPPVKRLGDAVYSAKYRENKSLKLLQELGK